MSSGSLYGDPVSDRFVLMDETGARDAINPLRWNVPGVPMELSSEGFDSDVLGQGEGNDDVGHDPNLDQCGARGARPCYCVY